jgi:hypothetical protein
LPTGRTGRALALAVLIALLAIAYFGIAVPLIDFYRNRDDVLATDRMIEPRFRLAASEVPRLQARVAELRRTVDTRLVTLDGASDALASAGLQSRIEGLAARSGIAIASTDGLPPEQRAGYRRIGLRISVSGTYEGIVKLLGAIETANPPLAVDNLQIHGRPVVAGALYAPQLDAGFAVYGLRSAETATATKP